MSYELHRNEAVPEAIRRVVRRCLRKAQKALDNGGVSKDDNVHEARKRFREARAAVRLVRGELGATAFDRENQAIRDASRPLSEVRDAKVLLDRLDTLQRQLENQGHWNGVERLRDELITRRQRARERVAADGKVLSVISQRSRDVTKRSKRWRLRRRGWKAIEGGLRKVYEKGRAAMTDCTQPSDMALHEWRKRAKDLRYELQFLCDVCPTGIRRLADRAHRVTDLLGEDHDLAIMRAIVCDLSRRGDGIDAEALTTLIDERRRALQMSAFVVGERLYEQHADAFVRRVARRWKAARR